MLQILGAYFSSHLSHCIRKPTICIAKTKARISCAVTAQLISAFVFARGVVQSLFLNLKFKASSRHLFCDFTGQFVLDLVRNAYSWFSHAKAHFIQYDTGHGIIFPPEIMYTGIKCSFHLWKCK